MLNININGQMVVHDLNQYDPHFLGSIMTQPIFTQKLIWVDIVCSKQG